MSPYQGVIRRYSKFLPVKEDCIVTLLEGNTPLLRAERIQRQLKLSCDLFLKYEGLNPTASFKDRGMTYAVSKAVEQKEKVIICASTGNTSASAAAYASRANLKCVVLIPHGNIAFGKLAQAMIHGAAVVQIRGNFDAALQMVVRIAKEYPVQVVNSINPFRLEGQKSAAFEICEELGYAPHYHFLPVGNAGNITAYWMGYQQWFREGHLKYLPKMVGVQAALSAPIVGGRPLANPRTIASAIRIGNPASWKGALKARDESGGIIDKVSDAEIVRAYLLIARLEGIFCEPASAVSVAGVMKMAKRGLFKRNETVVCTLTGHGLKDPDTAVKYSAKPNVVDANLKRIVKELKL